MSERAPRPSVDETARASRRGSRRWNHNVHYHPRVLAAVPPHCERALDVGCGEGVLARELRSVADRVVGIDLDAASIERARAQGGDGIEWVCGDVLARDFEPASFDLVASVASLHHMDAEAGLERLRALVRPGGTLVVIGLARSGSIADLAFDVAGGVASWLVRSWRGYWEHDAPKVWPPPRTYAEMRRIAERALPGVRYRRHLHFRYSLVWRRAR